ncbi:MAG: putative lipid II flippase FtsW [Deltaproteobacteria bacterium]|nr:putative lipid II flippase FtsW [Deltaproteobacteria bacterium]MBW1873887.1 putative lipid II flippase FtsW [Deltaproteobacteria bacterium]MBW2549176.1 putative lipid II flippase FtsW [Deltaproteobacteria bacterium]MBW2626002.1 putative lipid II flippase FtsW [Deltaproteobacteria bacterium]MBW2684297.1 putative lipid II flippase FtsW [Deltaproteobacteria bacterium]
MSRASKPAPPMEPGPPDVTLAATLVGLIAFGVVMVYSASAVYANNMFGNGFHFLIRQTVFAVAAFVVLIIFTRVDIGLLRRSTYPVLLVAVLLMIAVALGFGRSAGGATRWLAVGPVNVQPAELAKLAMIMWLAHSLAKKSDRMRTFSIGFLPHVLVAGLLMLLCLAQPDFGSAVMIAVLTFVVLFAAGAKAGYLLGCVLLAVPIGYAAIASSPYRMRRIKAFLEPFEHRQGAGYQITESLMSFGSGGWTGVGLGDGRQKLLFLPEAHTDFISAIIGEELGFIGVVLLCAAFGWVVFRGLRAAWRAQDEYAGYLAAGMTLFIGLQAFTNLAVALGLLPTKGLALPFVSYGGSSLLVNAAAAGIILNTSRYGVSRAVEASAPTKTKRRQPRLTAARGGT